MPVRIDIANAALGHVGESHLIANLATDRTPAGIAIKRFYDQARSSSFAEHDWQFARRWTTVTRAPEVPPTWAYAYLRPSLCAAVRMLLSSEVVIDFGLGGITLADGSDVDLVLAQEPATHLVWTREVTNEARWPGEFATAFTWRLAALICRTLGKDEATRAVCWEQAGAFMTMARTLDQRQMRQQPIAGDYLSARQ
jgi:hypothetical protein